MGEVVLLSDQMPDMLPMQGRSLGVHVSDVISDLCVRLGHYGDDTTLTSTWAQLGCAIEDALWSRFERHSPGEYCRGSEMVVDGIYMTPDFARLSDLTPDECKLTWMSAANGPRSKKFWRYETQLKCYCRGFEVTTGRLHVTFVNGDYKEAGPMYRCWEYRWTQADIDANWRMIRRHAAQMIEERSNS